MGIPKLEPLKNQALLLDLEPIRLPLRGCAVFNVQFL